MKKIVILIIVLLTIDGCDDSNGGSKETIDIVEVCNSSDDTTNYQIVKSGDVIEQKETLHSPSEKSKIEIFHSEDGLKKVCLKSGSATILR